MNLDQAINIEDLHRIAKRKLPRVIFDYIEGGVEDERGLARNEAAFHKHRLLPRYLVDVSQRDQSATVFGRTYSSPFGISPTGGVGLYRREGEVMLAEAAAAANIPYIMSGGSNASMEEAARVASNNLLFVAGNGALPPSVTRTTSRSADQTNGFASGTRCVSSLTRRTPGTASTEATALRRPSSENASAPTVTSRPATAILVLSSTVSLSADVERAARSDSRGAVLVQAANAQRTTSGIVPGHHLLLHLKSPCIRRPAGLGTERKQTLAGLSNPK